MIDVENRRKERFLLERPDALRLIANRVIDDGDVITKATVDTWLRRGKIPSHLVPFLYQRYRETEAYNLRLQGNKSLELLGKH